MRVAVFGGSFDPPHIAHVLAVCYARSVGFDKVFIPVVYNHAFGKALSPFEHRVAMAELAFRYINGADVSTIEQSLSVPNYTLNTVRAIHHAHPDWQLALLVGADALADTSRWHGFDELRQLAPPFVVGRTGFTPPGAEEPSLPEVSSSKVRKRLSHGSASDDHWLERHVPHPVLRYARAHSLYHTGMESP